MEKKTDIVKPKDVQELQLQLALQIVRLKDLKCLGYSFNSVDLSNIRRKLIPQVSVR